ncbi:hypothetical protein [Micromonospora chersina]
MSWLDEPVDAGSVAFSARLTIKAHEDGRPCCLDCPGPDCRQWAWARQALTEQTTPARRPAA